ncbi:MAG: RNA polymerase sigma factor [Candidatus Dormibacteraceae bacterium]
MRQIAEILGISDGTVKSSLHRSRATLRRKIMKGWFLVPCQVMFAS